VAQNLRWYVSCCLVEGRRKKQKPTPLNYGQDRVAHVHFTRIKLPQSPSTAFYAVELDRIRRSTKFTDASRSRRTASLITIPTYFHLFKQLLATCI